MIIKICSSCKLSKDISEYSKNYENKDGYLYICKKCARDSFKLRSDTLEGRLNNIFTTSKSSAKIRGLEHNIVKQDLFDLLLKQNGKCAMTNCDLSYIRFDKNLISLDRVNNDIGYVKNNIQFVTHQVNMCKKDLHINEFIALCKKVSEYVNL